MSEGEVCLHVNQYQATFVAWLACIIYATTLSVYKRVYSSQIMGGVKLPHPSRWIYFFVAGPHCVVFSAFGAPKRHHKHWINGGACGEHILQ